jgi:hypothetical protein
MQDELESVTEQRDQLEEELCDALEDCAEKDELIAALKGDLNAGPDLLRQKVIQNLC